MDRAHNMHGKDEKCMKNFGQVARREEITQQT
jgi:hypothetical protein